MFSLLWWASNAIDGMNLNNEIRVMVEMGGFLLPHRLRSSSEAGRPCWRSLRSLFLRWRHSGRLRIPSALCALKFFAIHKIRVVVEMGGFEPPASCMRSKRSTRWATSPIIPNFLFHSLYSNKFLLKIKKCLRIIPNARRIGERFSDLRKEKFDSFSRTAYS